MESGEGVIPIGLRFHCPFLACVLSKPILFAIIVFFSFCLFETSKFVSLLLHKRTFVKSSKYYIVLNFSLVWEAVFKAVEAGGLSTIELCFSGIQMLLGRVSTGLVEIKLFCLNLQDLSFCNLKASIPTFQQG